MKTAQALSQRSCDRCSVRQKTCVARGRSVPLRESVSVPGDAWAEWWSLGRCSQKSRWGRRTLSGGKCSEWSVAGGLCAGNRLGFYLFWKQEGHVRRSACWRGPSSSCPICCHLGEKKKAAWGFPGRVVVKNPPANAGDVASIPGLGGPHTWQSN